MFASGALASMFFPLVSITYALLFLQMWMAIAVGALTVVNIFFTVMFSFKVGDLWKAKKTLDV